MYSFFESVGSKHNQEVVESYSRGLFFELAGLGRGL
jgi:hypothetical protein